MAQGQRCEIVLLAAEPDSELATALAGRLRSLGATVCDAAAGPGAPVKVVVLSRALAGDGAATRTLGSWLADHEVEPFFVLADGEVVWDTAEGRLDPARTTALPREVLGSVAEAPLYVDLRGGADARGHEEKLQRAVVSIAAASGRTPAPSGGIAPAAPRPSSSVSAPGPVAPGSAEPLAASPAPRRHRRMWLLAFGASALVVVAALIAFAVSMGSDEAGSPAGAPGTTVPAPAATEGFSTSAPPATTRTPSLLPGVVSPSLAADSSDGDGGGVPAWPFVVLVAAAVVGGILLGRLVPPLRRTEPSTAPASPAPVAGGAGPLPLAEPAAGKQVFVSHDMQHDEPLARRIADDIRPVAPVWLAQDRIVAGENWFSAIERGLLDSRHVVVLFTRSSVSSPWVLKEVQATMNLEAEGADIRLIPVKVEDCRVPLLVRAAYQMVSMEAGYDRGRDQILRAITV